jgi:hypothetical protein
VGRFDKRNRNATRRRVTAWALGGGLVGGLIGLFGWFRSDRHTAAVFFLVPWMVAFGAVAGGALEWQIPWDRDEDG